MTSTENHYRNTEASAVELQDGRILMLFSRFTTSAKTGQDGSIGDDEAAQIYSVISHDQGYTWSEPTVYFPDKGRQNAMSVSLLRLANGDLLAGYLKKESSQDCQFVVRISHDESQTWSEPIPVSTQRVYHVVNNDRLIQTKDGTMMTVAAWTEDVEVEDPYFYCRVFRSRDGKTWQQYDVDFAIDGVGCQEPGLVELATPGHLLMVFRTSLGAVYQAKSKDNGLTWAAPSAIDLPAPKEPAPVSIAKVPDDNRLMLIWHHSEEKRSPLSIAISDDEGSSWRWQCDLETDPNKSYGYASVTWLTQPSRALISYWEGYYNANKLPILNLRVANVSLAWLMGE